MAKSAEAFRTISEVSDYLETPAHVLRFWESRFTQIRPVKRAGGRRYYRPADMALLSGIKKLLHDDGLTIRGVQKILKEQGVRHVADLGGLPFTDTDADDEVARATREAAGAPGSNSAMMPDDAKAAAVAAAETDATGDLFTMRPAPRADVSPGAAMRAAIGRKGAAPGGDAPEAPMQVDVPTLPEERGATLHRLAGAAADTASATSDDAATGADLTPDPAATRTGADRQPAAVLLRAMDALRARDKKSELKSVYLRLSDLRSRLSRGTGPNPDG
ncbi:MAG: MerR family transcriptional regulator [Alphaproteobacteria bacterium HGW-Alphaproteobacteria-6]|nr:MAG: MerR family transcriptional regulator [Alphaproteobacteria bacterium HGW-Alphaproteobacteria-6]